MTLGVMSNELSPVPWTTRLKRQGKVKEWHMDLLVAMDYRGLEAAPVEVPEPPTLLGRRLNTKDSQGPGLSP